MNCKNASALISRSIDSTLNLKDRVRLYLHLRDCNECKTLKANFVFLRQGCQVMVPRSPADKCNSR